MDVLALHAAIAAVCPILGVSVGDPTDHTAWRIDFDPAATDAQRQAAQQLVAGWTGPAATPAPVTFLGFLALFTAAEQAAIVATTDPRIRLFCLMAAGATFVNLMDPRVIAGAQLLESLGLLRAGRAAQVLAEQAPPST